jgi:uncharacterized protein (TIGR02147 family)
MTNLYQVSDYKEYLRDKIKDRRQERGYPSRLAEAAGIHRSYLSQVLHGNVHLTPDHAAALSDYWKLDGDDSEHFLNLVNFARAGSPSLRRMLDKRIKEAKSRHQELSDRHRGAKQLSEEDFAEYYSNWYFSAIHILLGIPSYQTPQKIAMRLMLSEEIVQKALEKLEQLKVIRRGKKGTWELSAGDLFLPKASALTTPYHTVWRERAMCDSQYRRPDSVHYTMVYSMSKIDVEKLRERILDLIEEMRTTIKDSANEELVTFACDFFRV